MNSKTADSKDNTSNLTKINESEDEVHVSHGSPSSSMLEIQSIPFSLKAEIPQVLKSTDGLMENKDTMNVNDVNSNQDVHICKDDEHPINATEYLEKNNEPKEDNIPNSSKQLNVNPYNSSPPQPTKTKLKCTKRRAGVLYKKLISSKVGNVTSKYFNQVHKAQNRWIPPRSPYALVQEDLFDKPWQLLVATIFLTKTAAKRALPQLHKFLARFPRPEDVLQANYEAIDEFFKPLGLTNTRSHIIMRFTVEFLEKNWTYPRELYGIGKYGDDSYRMFCINEWRQVSPDDIPLTMYRNWLLENADRLGIT